MIILGIDIGLSGAMAILRDDGSAKECLVMPVESNNKPNARVKQQISPSGLVQLLNDRELPGIAIAYVEDLQPLPDFHRADGEAAENYPGQRRQGVTGIFSMGDSRGCVRAVLATLNIPFTIIRPQEWKKYFDLTRTGSREHRTIDKDASRLLAIDLFPTIDLSRKKDHNRAEALLIAEYGRRRYFASTPSHFVKDHRANAPVHHKEGSL